MVIAIAPIVFIVVGLLMWLLSANGKVQRMGEIIFAVGVFMLGWVLAAKTVHVG